MEHKFYLNRFIYSILGMHIFIYICWSFVELSFTIPFIETFSTNNSRGFYLMFVFCCLCCFAPFYCPIEKD